MAVFPGKNLGLKLAKQLGVEGENSGFRPEKFGVYTAKQDFEQGIGGYRRIYPLVIKHSHGKWPIETDDFPS